ncbi:DUF4148 domain-containing protein [Paraburkholderia sabiae]|uniref:DUF4148 domain-containing protein n=1 Tax=Paraburkholderia sabiae TaxID=273251 RepID=A0ABU9Q948_9BURK|nr:DUF4148 domain-containing protein [Paraburkholderia sabiae]WJZ78491.1 DUF4148 domain-containing protein [Paraburkholderia sabiae]CAD6509175.1 hypothetical protein LMG24235_00231 [Paraburkholderia sabiae]
MRSLAKTVAVLFVLAVPVAAFAQSTQSPITRAQVRAELVQAEKDGYSPLAWADYPYGEIQAAEFRAAAHNAKAADASGYGPATNGTSQSGDIAR